ncbi:hypothetical protein [Nocardia salmonicida]|jgi:diacylglycerol O-acyltransferase / wax synthase|uniref:hypothetical protein n=1 Tax=Nocardia salmonicida TaxID=53431 RepID=UPI0007A4FFA9|nr:hypothetical protein [Nocardia salmonicida]
MNSRLADLDCLSARTQKIRGPVGIHCVWLYDRAVYLAGLHDFHEALRRGPLSRTIVPAAFGPAGDRWTAVGRFADLVVEPDQVKRAELQEWIAERACAELSVYGGPAWRLTAAALDNDTAVVSLLVSHSLADGLGTYLAVAAAVHGLHLAPTYDSDGYSRLRLFADEVHSAVRRTIRAAKALPRALTATNERRNVLSAGVVATGLPTWSERPRIPVVGATVPAAEWKAAADERGGSSSTLAVAISAGIATALGRTDEQGKAGVSIAVNTRTADDFRANALTEIHLDVDVQDGPLADLLPLRRRMKEMLTDPSWKRSAEAGITVAAVLPRSLLPTLVRSVFAADYLSTGCSLPGAMDDAVLRIDGAPATEVLVYHTTYQRLESEEELCERGGVLTVAAVEIAGKIRLSIRGWHPTTRADDTDLAHVVSDVFRGYGLEPHIVR